MQVGRNIPFYVLHSLFLRKPATTQVPELLDIGVDN